MRLAPQHAGTLADTMRLLPLLLLVTSSCATLNTLGMSPACRDLYNACLNSCPQAPAPQARRTHPAPHPDRAVHGPVQHAGEGV